MLLNRKPRSLVAQEWTRTDVLDPSVASMPSGTPAQSLLDASVRITGDLYGRGDIRLDGKVCGNVTCTQLIVGPDAAITGAVRAEQVVVRGRVTGTIRANLVILHRTARVEAEITYGLLALDEGAAFEGLARCRPNPLQDDDPTSTLDDLQRMLASPRPGGDGRSTETARVGDRPHG